MPTSDGFSGLRVVSFESRMADIMQQNIAKRGGEPVSAPSLQEIPLEKNSEAFLFGEKLFSGMIHVLICMTGVGTRLLVDILSTRYTRPDIVALLTRTTIVARGPKPVQALRDLGVPVTLTVPEPNTWFEILETLDLSRRSIDLKGRTVAVQEYGIANDELVRGLKKRGANVLQVPVYRWALPDDTGPLERAIDEIVRERVHVALFTNAMQVRNVLRMASTKGCEQEFRRGLANVVIASIGPTTSEALQENGLHVDLEPAHAKIGHLLEETAGRAKALLEERRAPQVKVRTPAAGDPREHAARRRQESVFLRACRREKTPYTPVWLMRQAGRYLKEYRRLRDRVPFIELCRNPQLAAEVAVSACEALGVDAAILFSDILLIVEPMGLGLEYSAGEGPVITGEADTAAAVDALREVNPEESLSFVFDAVRLTRATLDPKIPLIGFSGAPFTLAAYIIEGGGSKAFIKTKRFMYSDPGAWKALMEKIGRALVKYLRGQIEAGADALQIFDSWVGCLSPRDYREYVLPYTKQVLDGVGTRVPVIQFGTGTGPFLKDLCKAGGDVISVDFRIELDEAWQAIGPRAIQGNLDPALLLGPQENMRKEAQRILAQAGGRPGHIFNLGHGVLPNTPEENVKRLVALVHELSAKERP